MNHNLRGRMGPKFALGEVGMIYDLSLITFRIRDNHVYRNSNAIVMSILILIFLHSSAIFMKV